MSVITMNAHNDSTGSESKYTTKINFNNYNIDDLKHILSDERKTPMKSRSPIQKKYINQIAQYLQRQRRKSPDYSSKRQSNPKPVQHFRVLNPRDKKITNTYTMYMTDIFTLPCGRVIERPVILSDSEEDSDYCGFESD